VPDTVLRPDVRGCVEIDGASELLSAKFRKSGSRPSRGLLVVLFDKG
jgi:hypothetical protein